MGYRAKSIERLDQAIREAEICMKMKKSSRKGWIQRQHRPALPFFGVPNMFDSLEVQVLFTSDGREVMAKRKGEITLAARRGLKEAAEQRCEPLNKNRM
jgi:hypothetical protein